MKTNLVLLLAASAIPQLGSAGAAEISLATAPPVVVRTEPVAGSGGVDPRTSEILVTFSKPMQDGSWSWSTWGEENYPETIGEPNYLADGRTCVLKVKLQPGKFYALWLNSDKFKNFKDAAGQPAVPYLLTFRTATVNGNGAVSGPVVFGPTVETVLKVKRGRVAELLDLDTGQRATSATFGENDRETHAWVRDQKLDLLGVIEKGQIALLCMDMLVPPAANGAFDRIAAETVRTNWHLAQGEPNKITAISPGQDKTDTFFFKTREGALGLLQILGQSDAPAGVKVRYKLVQLSARNGGDRAGGTGGEELKPVAPTHEHDVRLNDDQRAVLAWTDRQFKSFFDRRTFDGWSPEERAALERKLIDALNGPRSTEYFQAINSLAALRSTDALPKLRGIAYERVDRNNRDRWMAIRALGLIGDPADVPELIHLVYHGNQNTHWWAQISLVRITGQNLGKDWNAWGKWWNDQKRQPPYNPEIIRWWNGQAEPDKLAASLAEGDEKFLAGIKPK